MKAKVNPRRDRRSIMRQLLTGGIILLLGYIAGLIVARGFSDETHLLPSTVVSEEKETPQNQLSKASMGQSNAYSRELIKSQFLSERNFIGKLSVADFIDEFEKKNYAEQDFWIKTYCQIAPKKALQVLDHFGASMRHREVYAFFALQQLSKSDNEHAVNWITTNWNSLSMRDSLLNTVFASWAKRDHISAKQFFMKNYAGLESTQPFVYSIAASLGRNEGPVEVIKWVDQLKRRSDKNLALYYGSNQLMLEDPLLAIDWLTAHLDYEGAVKAMGKPFRLLARADMELAQSALEDVPRNTQALYNATFAVASELHSADPLSARQWRESLQEDAMQDAASAAFANAVVETNKAEAADWIISINRPSTRERQLRALLESKDGEYSDELVEELLLNKSVTGKLREIAETYKEKSNSLN